MRVCRLLVDDQEGRHARVLEQLIYFQHRSFRPQSLRLFKLGIREYWANRIPIPTAKCTSRSMSVSLYVSHRNLLGQKQVVAVSGESARSTFLTAKGFDIHPGFKDLLGGVNPFSFFLPLAPFRTRCSSFLIDPHGQGRHFRPPRKDHCPYLSTAGHDADTGQSVKSYVTISLFRPEMALTPLINISDSAAFVGLLQRRRRLGKAWSARSISEYI